MANDVFTTEAQRTQSTHRDGWNYAKAEQLWAAALGEQRRADPETGGNLRAFPILPGPVVTMAVRGDMPVLVSCMFMSFIHPVLMRFDLR